MRKKKILLIAILIIASSLSYSCLNKTDFSKKDFNWIKVYDENEILVFQETISKKKDTTIIKKKELYHAEYQPIARGNLIPHTFILRYWNKKYADQGIPNAQLIEMYKDDDNIDAYPWINYLGFSYGVDEGSMEINQVSLSLTENSFSQVLIFERNKNRLHKQDMSTQPKILFWDKKNGIIKYETFGGEIWERINFK